MSRFDIHIALVDDSHAILMMLRANLRELGYNNIDVYPSAVTALGKIRSLNIKYDAVFTDLNMPNMDGMEFIRKMGEQAYQGGIVIVSDMDQRVICLASELAKRSKTHLIGNLNKPILLESLVNLLDKIHLFLDRGVQSSLELTENELLNAISRNQITPYYQPKVDSKTNRVSSLEVLARIIRPGDSAPVPPCAFIPAAERYNLIDVMTFQLLEKSTSDYVKLVQTFDADIKISINLSPVQLTNFDFPNKLETIIKQNGMKPSQIILEITEEHALNSQEQLETLNRLRIRGFGLSLDDFGTGFTNLNQLRTLPFTEIKIDRSLISCIQCDRFSQTIIGAIVDLSIEQHIDLVAEGIEGFDELEFLRNYEKNITFQGYLISEPKPIDELLKWHAVWENAVFA